MLISNKDNFIFINDEVVSVQKTKDDLLFELILDSGTPKHIKYSNTINGDNVVIVKSSSN